MMSAENELPSASHMQAAQTLEMVSQQAVVHQDGQVLMEQAVPDNQDLTPMVSQPQHVVDMHNYVSTASDTVIHMSGGTILTQQGHIVTQAGVHQMPNVPQPSNVAPVAMPVMQQMQLDHTQSPENVVIKLLQQQQLKLLEKSRAKQQSLQQQQQNLRNAGSALMRDIQEAQAQKRASNAAEVHAAEQLQRVAAEVEAAEKLQRVQLQTATLRQQLAQAPLGLQANTMNNFANLNQAQLQGENVQDPHNALQVHSVVSLKDNNIISGGQYLQIQDSKTGQQVVIETSVSDNNETALQLQFVPDPQTENQSASKNKQVVLPADAPPPPVLEDEELRQGEPPFQEPSDAAYNDKLLWCHDCGVGVKVVCRQHGDMTKVKDRIIPSRAKLTAPHHVSIKVIELRAGGKNVYGVFAKKVIQRRTVFGPYEGLLKDTWDYKGSSRIMLKLFSAVGPSKYLDCVEQDYCNWMIFVRPARSIKEQNLVAYQYKGSIYFATTKAIAPGAELKVWYSASYGSAIGAHSLPVTAPDENSEFSALLNEADFEGLELPMECENDDLDYQTPSLEKDLQVNMAQSEPPAPEPVAEVPAQPVEQKYTCIVCKIEFPGFESLHKHECVVMKAAKQRKSQAGKAKKRMIKVEKESRDAKPTSISGGKGLGVSTRASRRGGRRVATPVPEETNNDEKELEDDQTVDLEDDVNELEGDDDTYNPVSDLVIAAQSQKRGPGRPKGSKAKMVGVKGSPRKKITKPKTLFPCEECDKAFSSMKKLKAHSFQHTGEKPFVCKFNCGKAFSSKFKQIRHELIHAGEKRHACPYCQKTFSRKDHLKNHLRIHDPNKELFKCTKCGKEYASPFAYKTHLAIHSAEEGDMTCGVCKEEFKDKDLLFAHLKVHAGARSIKDSEKTQQCTFCDKLFFTKKDVKRHIVVHTKDRDFLCQFCPQRFGRRDHLVRHLNKAHPELGKMPDVNISPTAMAQPDPPPPKKQRSRSSAHRNQQTPVLNATSMSELLQSVTRHAILDTNIPPNQEVREIEVQLISAKDSSGQEVMIPVSQAGGIMTNMMGVNYGGNLQNVYQGQSKEVTAVLSQPISEPIMSGHFVPPSYVPQQGEEEEGATRQNQGQTNPTLSTILSSDPRFAVSSLAQTQPQQHPIFTYGTLPGFSGDPNQPQKIMLASVPNPADLGDQQIQIQQGNMVFTMKASALLDQYAQQAQSAAAEQNQQAT